MGSKAKLEYHALKKLRILGVDTIEPLGVLYERRGPINSPSYLVTRAKIDFITLLDFLSYQDLNKIQIRNLLRNLAHFLANLHQTGFLSKDMHTGNILVKATSENLEFCLIDVHRVSFISHSLSLSQRQKSLAFIIHSVYRYFGIRDIIRFLKYYAEVYKEVNKQKDFIRQIFKKFWIVKRHHDTSRTKRCVSTNTGFEVKRYNTWQIYRRKEITLNEIIDIIKSSKDYFILKAVDSRSIALYNGKFVKRYFHNTLSKKIENFFRGSPGFRSWVNSNGLLVRGVSTPKCFALIENSKEGVLIGEWLNDTTTLGEFIKKELTNSIPYQRKEFLWKFANFLRMLHQEGIYHSDLKANNIIVQKMQDKIKFHIIDLDRVSFEKISLSRIFKNLAQLNASIGPPITRTDRLRFYTFYANIYLLRNKKFVIERVMKLTKKRRHIWP
jgi:tRNA A-37 threonylcarbamoyl transferase component Bud32